MVEENEHSACVRAWLQQTAKGLSPSQRMSQAFEQAFQVMWQRAALSLGEVTLLAIAERVLYNAAAKFPLLSPLKLESSGLHCQELDDCANGLSPDQVERALGYVLLEFLTVLGNLTAEVLTPALHAALLKTAQPQPATPDAEDA